MPIADGKFRPGGLYFCRRCRETRTRMTIGSKATRPFPIADRIIGRNVGSLPPPTPRLKIYQELGSSPGSVYQASGWFYVKPTDDMGNPTFNSYVWIDVSFLDAGGNLLALAILGDFTANINGRMIQYQVTNIVRSINSGVHRLYHNYAVTDGDAVGRAEQQKSVTDHGLPVLYNGERPSCSDAALNQLLSAARFANMLPQNMIFFPQSNGFNFDASSPSGSTINNSGIHLRLNGVDVSSNLVISGSSSSKTVSYLGLQSNMICQADNADAYNPPPAPTPTLKAPVGTPPRLFAQ